VRARESVRGADPFPLPVRFKLVTDPVLTPRWDAIAGLADAPPVSIEGTFTEIADVFRSDGSPRRLVVLGEVGAGKSALVMRLTLDLLRTRTGADPVPVLLSVASWDPGEDLEDWVAARLGEQYPGLSVNVAELGGRSRSIARALLARLLVLPVLDGLDEMAAPNRGRALQQLSAACEGVSIWWLPAEPGSTGNSWPRKTRSRLSGRRWWSWHRSCWRISVLTF
jgi:hypothetical protein